MATVKKFITDAVYTTRAEALAALAEALANCSHVNMDLEAAWSITHDNLGHVTDAEGNSAATLAADENAAPVLQTGEKVGDLALVTIWHDPAQNVPQPEGAPYAIPKGIYLIAVPTFDELATDVKLQEIARKMIQAAQLKAARAQAKAHAADPQASPLSTDRVAGMIAASASRAGDPAARAFKALYPVILRAMSNKIDARVEALKAAGRHADARNVAATYSKARFNSTTMLECLQSADAAARHFPGMAQTQWENMLKFAIHWAPSHKIGKIVKDAQGNPVKTTNPETGKEIVKREYIPAPISPTPFMAMLETRNERTLAPSEAPTVDFSDMTA